MRWSTSVSRLVLPVVSGMPMRVTLDVSIPREALSPAAGLYLNGKQIARAEAGANSISVNIPAVTFEPSPLELRCNGWVPMKAHSGSPGPQDTRNAGLPYPRHVESRRRPYV